MAQPILPEDFWQRLANVFLLGCLVVGGLAYASEFPFLVSNVAALGKVVFVPYSGFSFLPESIPIFDRPVEKKNLFASPDLSGVTHVERPPIFRVQGHILSERVLRNEQQSFSGNKLEFWFVRQAVKFIPIQQEIVQSGLKNVGRRFPWLGI